MNDVSEYEIKFKPTDGTERVACAIGLSLAHISLLTIIFFRKIQRLQKSLFICLIA